MQREIAEDPVVRAGDPIDEALDDSEQRRAYKRELIEDRRRRHLALPQGAFTDLCRGPHVPERGRSRRSSSPSSPARTGAATSTTRSCSASTAPHSSPRTTSTPTSSGSKRPQARPPQARQGARPLQLPRGRARARRCSTPRATVIRNELRGRGGARIAERGYVEVMTPHIYKATCGRRRATTSSTARTCS